MTLEVRQAKGGSWSMALWLSRSATQPIPRGPRCLRSWGGSELRPELLSALKWWVRVAVSSAGVMCWVAALRTGVYSSGGIEAS